VEYVEQQEGAKLSQRPSQAMIFAVERERERERERELGKSKGMGAHGRR